VSRARLLIFVSERDQELADSLDFGVVDFREWLRWHGFSGRYRRMGKGLCSRHHASSDLAYERTLAPSESVERIPNSGAKVRVAMGTRATAIRARKKERRGIQQRGADCFSQWR
jgi:hypothetical protein